MEIPHGDRNGYVDTLIEIRKRFAAGNYQCGVEAQEVQARAVRILQGSVPPYLREQTIADYFFGKLAAKVSEADGAMLGRKEVRSVQVFAQNLDGTKLLLQRRGDYKRLYPSALTVSANAEATATQPLQDRVAEAFQRECGLEIEPSRFFRVGKVDGFMTRLRAVQFIAVTPEEERRQEIARIELGERASADGMSLDCHPRKRELCLQTLDPNVCTDAFLSMVRELERLCGTPPLFAADVTNRMSLFTIYLQDKEGRDISDAVGRIKGKLESARRATVLSEEHLAALDQDVMEFVPVDGLHKRFQAHPYRYAGDLASPYLGDQAVLEDLRPDVLQVTDRRCARVEFAGGKGANTHRLKKLADATKEPTITVPGTLVVPTRLFERYVLKNRRCRELLDRLHETRRERDEEKRRKDSRDPAEQLRTAIEQLELSPKFVETVGRELERFDGPINVAVRSSATIEDVANDVGAGRAKSHLNVRTVAEVVSKIKSVWAGLFSEEFVADRFARDLDFRSARMAVLIQPMADARVSGVALSVHQETKRPVFTIESQPGVAGVVDGKGSPDRWVVGLNADTLLEESIQVGRTERERPSRTQVLELAEQLRAIREYYRRQGFADEIDVEFCISTDDKIVVLQARPMEAVASKNVKQVILTVDESRVSAEVRRIDLGATSAAPVVRAVYGQVQFLEEEGASVVERVRPGVILVAFHTNNAFNGVFAKLAGLVTAEGGMNSHAALNAPIHGVACVVGASAAFEELRHLDGQWVTLDPDRRKAYLGKVPLIEVTRDLNIWVATPDVGLPNSELLRSWEKNLEARPDVFHDEFDGRWRRRSEHLSAFQLDCYYQAWDRLIDEINGRFPCGKASALRAPERDIRATSGVARSRGKGLFTRMPVPNECNVVEFLKDIDLDQIVELYNARHDGLEAVERSMRGVDRVTASNVEEIVRQYVEILKWMHFAFWLNQVVDNGVAFHQLKYVNPHFHDLLKDRAVQTLEDDEEQAFHFERTCARRVRQLSLEKECDIHALAERIREVPAARDAFAARSLDGVLEQLRKSLPVAAEDIGKLSTKYKRSREDLRIRCDTHAYLNEIRGLLDSPTSLSIETLSLLRSEFEAAVSGSGAAVWHYDLRQVDPRLFFVLREAARHDLVERDGVKGRTTARSDISRAAAEQHIGAILEKIENHRASVSEKIRTIDAALERFPTLKRIAALSKLETVLREDGHHRIVPLQRRLAELMLDVARTKCSVLPQPEDVFEISSAEFIALVKEEEPTYVRGTLERWPLLEAAQRRLRDRWADDPHSALHEYRSTHGMLVEILDLQAGQAKDPRVKAAYAAERERLEGRLASYERLPGSDAHESHVEDVIESTSESLDGTNVEPRA
jgi:phosphohistidine swiveling domain-containing protein